MRPDYNVLATVSPWHDRLDVVQRAHAKSTGERVTSDFGELTWLRHLGNDDLATFLTEVRAAVSVAYQTMISPRWTSWPNT